MIILKDISKKMGLRTLFENVNVSFQEGHRYGLTGPNGSGKSTLLKIVMGLEDPSSGNVIRPKRTGYLKQNIESFAQCRVIDTVLMGHTELWETFTERLELLSSDLDDEGAMRLAHVEEKIADLDGYMAESEAESLLAGMAIPASVYESTMSSIPLDWQFRVLVCQALFGKPQALLLDEPTNHLDLEAIGWLEEFLKSYPGIVIVISHDRHFINAVATDIADIDYETVILYPGNYDEMVVNKSEARSRAEDANKSKERKVAQLQEFVARFGAGTRSSQVKSRIREMARLQPQELKKSNILRPYIHFDPPVESCGQNPIRLKSVDKSYIAGTPVIKDFSIYIEKEQKIGVIGANGRGKTTLLKLLAEVHKADKGDVEVNSKVKVGYFPQNHQDLIDKTLPMNLFEWLRQRHNKVTDQEIRSALGKLLFSGDDVFKKLHTLSGGETARLILADLILSKPNILILDEPNGHLDLESVSALATALEDFPGPVIVASHDRTLIESCANRIISFEPKGIVVYNGTFEEYLASSARRGGS